MVGFPSLRSFKDMSHHDFRQWRRDGTWQRIHDALRRQVRVASGRQEEPEAAILDSQSVKTTEKGASRL